MRTTRTGTLEWIEQGRMPTEVLPAALRLTGITPGLADWRRFLVRLALWLDTVFRVAPDDDMILTGLRGADLALLGTTR